MTFVKRTGLILKKQRVNVEGHSLFTRLRRFGKTLALSMFADYDLKEKEKEREKEKEEIRHLLRYDR